jgi:hypothetical protein
MQWEKATVLEFAARELTGPSAFDEPPEPVDDELPPHAAASKTRTAGAMMAAAVRAAGGRTRRSRRMTRVLSLIMPSSGLDDRAGHQRRRPAGTVRRPGAVPFAETG